MKFLLYLSDEPWHYKLEEMEEVKAVNKGRKHMCKMFDLNIWSATLSRIEDII